MVNKAGIWISMEELEQIKKFEEEFVDRQFYCIWHGTMDGYEEYKILKYNEEILKKINNEKRNNKNS